MENIKNELLKKVNDEQLFDFIANDSHKLSHTELKSLALELSYSLHLACNYLSKDDKKELYEELKMNLEENL